MSDYSECLKTVTDAIEEARRNRRSIAIVTLPDDTSYRTMAAVRAHFRKSYMLKAVGGTGMTISL